MKRDIIDNKRAVGLRKRSLVIVMIAFAIAFLSVFSLIEDNSVHAASCRCPGCNAAVSTKLTKKKYSEKAVTRKVTKKKLMRQDVYKLLNKCYNSDNAARTMFATKNKSTTVTWSVTGSATAAIDWGSLNLTSTYTKTSTKSSGGGTSRKVPAKTYIAFYVGHPVDVFSVNVTQTTRLRCPWCGRTLKTTTKSWCNKATVPVKDSTVYCKTVTSKTNSFKGTIKVNR